MRRRQCCVSASTRLPGAVPIYDPAMRPLHRAFLLSFACAVLASCASQPAADPTTTPEPTNDGTEITGDYEADLKAVGAAPEDVEQFRREISHQVCETDLADEYDARLYVLIGDSGPEQAGKVLRLTAAYDCPDRVPHVNRAIEKAKA